MNALLSVVVPVYNVEKYLVKCIESIINQSYQELEIILVDDGSTDSSGRLCDFFAEKDVRIKVIHKENEGLISARYVGVNHATAEYVTFVDSDDWIKKEMYEELMRVMVEEDVDLVTSGCIRYWADDDQKEDIDSLISYGLHEKDSIINDIVPVMLWCKKIETWALDPALWSKIFKKRLLLKQMYRVKEYRFYYGEDTVIVYPYILCTTKIFCLKQSYYYHRQRERNMIAPYFYDEDYLRQLYFCYDYLKTVFAESIYKDVLMYQLEQFYVKSVGNSIRKYGVGAETGIRYLFPFDKIEKGSQIVLYGAGMVGRQYYEQLRRLQYCEIVLWVDKNSSQNYGYDIGILNIENILKVEYDYIVIANTNEKGISLMKKGLENLGIKMDKVVNDIIHI